jgi:hypothetical protein
VSTATVGAKPDPGGIRGEAPYSPGPSDGPCAEERLEQPKCRRTRSKVVADLEHLDNVDGVLTMATTSAPIPGSVPCREFAQLLVVHKVSFEVGQTLRLRCFPSLSFSA